MRWEEDRWNSKMIKYVTLGLEEMWKASMKKEKTERRAMEAREMNN